MSAFWHPLSAVYLRVPRALASPGVVRLILSAEGHADLVYAGDRMWPALRHGEAVRVVPRPNALRGGDIVLAFAEGVVDFVRVAFRGGRMLASCDADPGAVRPLGAEQVLGALSPSRRAVPLPAAVIRLWLDLVEAATERPERANDPAATVRAKYDAQAVHYARRSGEALDAAIAESLKQRCPTGGKILVAGSGTGREALGVEALGYEVVGVDFSSGMVEAARANAAASGSRAVFVVSDLRLHEEPDGSLGGVLFTYDVYSFVPEAHARTALLRKMRRWLEPGGTLFLSARRRRGARHRVMLAVTRAAGRAREFGESHTRWLDSGGELRRSFVRYLSDREIDREAAAAGFRRLDWREGHGTFARVA